MELTLGSLFDGIGGWLLAAEHAGIRPAWSSEIEKFPLAVTKKRFPSVVQLGDVTKINPTKIDLVDIICAGSPCQDLSIAGNREGLAGERSGLFRTAVSIVRQMRMYTGGRQPRFFIWENVPGSFSSNKGMDFKSVLEEIGQTEIPIPTGNKWANAGLVECDQCEIAWRLLDAQYFGVPQRRKRIFLVADFGSTGRCAGQILFERQSVQRDSEQGGQERQTTSGNSAADIGNAVCMRMRGGKPGGGKGPLLSVDRLLTLAANTNDQILFEQKAYCIAGNMVDRDTRQNGLGISKDVASTLTATDRHAVFSMGHDERSAQFTPSITDPLTAADYKQPQIVCIGNGQANQCVSDKTGALNCMHDQQAVMQSLAVDGKNFVESNVNGPLLNSAEHNIESNNVVQQRYVVRRLTPLECERLQGLPDGYTLIDDKSCSDSARYKALGNGMAQPCADFVLRRLVEEVEG